MAKPIKVEILGDASGLSKAFDSAGTGIGKLAGLAAGAGVAIGGAVVGMSAVAIKGLADLGDKFDGIYDSMRVTTGKTGEALEELKDSFRNVAEESYSSMEDIGLAMEGLVQRLPSLTGKPLELVTQQVTDLTRLTEGDLATNVDKITRLFGDWQVPTEKMAETLDQLYRAGQNSGIPIEELAGSLVELGGPLRTMGFDLAESEALLAKWNKEGVNTETIFGGLRQAIGKFAKLGEDPAKEIRKIIDTIKELSKTDPGKAMNEAVGIFGKKAASDIVDAIVGGKFDIGVMFDEITKGTDTIAQASEDTADWAEQWQNIKNNVFLAIEPIAGRVFSAIGDGLDRWVRPAFENASNSMTIFADAWKRNDGVVTQSGFNGYVERSAFWLRKTGEAISEKLSPWLDDIAKKVEVQAIMLWPIFENSVNFARKAFEKLVKFAQDHELVMKGIETTVLGITAGLLLVAAAVVAVTAVFGALVGVVVIAIAGVVGAIRGFFDWIYNNRQKWIDNIKAPFVEGLGWVERKWNDLKQTFTNPFGGAFGALPGRAMGGSVGASGMYRINERSTPGGEQVFLPSGSRVQPAYAGGGGGGDTFNIYAPNATPAQVAAEIAWKRRMGNGR